MNRLQVGDECYVRNGIKQLFKAKVRRVLGNRIHVFIPAIRVVQVIRGDVPAKNGCKLLWNLVYPTEAIKRLAK